MTKLHRLAGALSAAVCTATATQVFADEPISVRGFGTLGYTVADTNDTSYEIYPFPEGADSSGTLKVDSKLGLQFDIEASERAGFTLQLYAQQDEEGSFAPGVEWAYGSFQLTDSMVVRAGKLSVPVFSVSDFREVGYANTFLRPPQDVYSNAPFGTMVGVDLFGSLDVGESLFDWHLGAGELKEKINDGAVLRGDDYAFINLKVQRGPATVRLGHMQFNINGSNASLNQLVGGLRQAAVMLPSLAQTADFIELDNDRMTITGAGFDLDFDSYFFKSELAVRRTDSFIADTTSWYAMVGKRIGNVTPYFYLSQLTQDSRTASDEIPALPQLAPLAAGVNSLLDDVSQDSVALGVRWDFYQNVALKAQYESISQESVGQNFFDDDPTYQGGERVGVFGLGLDFIF